jgi:hypothetical protein
VHRSMLVIARASAQAGLEAECYDQLLDNAQDPPEGVLPMEIFAYSEPGDVGLVCGVSEPSLFDDFFLDRVRNAPAVLSAWTYTVYDGNATSEYFDVIDAGLLGKAPREAMVAVRVETGVDRNVYPTLELLGWDGKVGVRSVYKTFHDEQTDYLVRIYGESLDALTRWVGETLRRVKGVLDTDTCFIDRSKQLCRPVDMLKFLDQWKTANDPRARAPKPAARKRASRR